MNRFFEPSTWAGFGVLAQTAKAFVPQHAIYLDCLSTIAGALAACLAEKARVK